MSIKAHYCISEGVGLYDDRFDLCVNICKIIDNGNQFPLFV